VSQLIGSASVPDLDARKAGVDTARRELQEWGDRVEKYRRKANEKDPDKQVFGEAMVQRVLAFLAEWDALLPVVEEWALRIEAEYAPVQRTREEQAEAERQLQARLAEEARQRESERRRREAEDARRAEEERQRRERERQEALERDREAAERAAQLVRDQEMQRRRELADYLARTPAPEVLTDSVRQLEANSSDRRQFEAVLRAVHGIMSNVLSYPDEEQFKTIRRANATFHEDVGRHPGAVGCLFALGFREQYDENETLLVLHEPEALEEYEEWKEWLDGATAIKATVERVFAALSEERYSQKPLDLPYVLGSH